MKHTTTTLNLNSDESYSESRLLSMALDQTGNTMADLMAHEVIANTATRCKMVLWF